MTTLYGALAMFPLGWALAGYALVSAPGIADSTERIRGERHLHR